MYNPRKKKRYNIDLRRINALVKPLEQLKAVIGMQDVKRSIVDHIVYFLQSFEPMGNEMLHTTIQGPPGVGKSMLGRIIGDIYLRLGKLKTNKFVNVRRSDLIGKYLGHTAQKTQDVIDSCAGGVLFIDEAYSLGNNEGKDIYSKECLDTLNRNLTERNDFICIIAGYKDALNDCFFSSNPGLKRRFPFTYTIEGYSGDELRDIFVKKARDTNWTLTQPDSGKPVTGKKFFVDNVAAFKHFGGDIENLLFCCKLEHAKRVFCLDASEKKKLNNKDIKAGFARFKKQAGPVIKEDDAYKSMYV